MQIVQGGKPFCMTYAAFDQVEDLFVGFSVYDATTGTPVFVELVEGQHVALGCYSANYTGVAGKTYLAIGLVYDDDLFTSIDTDRAPWADCYQLISSGVTLFAFNYAAYDHNESLPIQARVFDVSTGSPVELTAVVLSHVLSGVYFGSFTGVTLKTYQTFSVVYLTDTYIVPDENRGQAVEDFFGLVASTSEATTIVREAILIGPDNTQEFDLEGPDLSQNYILVGDCS